ncbi:hypothetical protein BN000_01817 [Neobacillus massiliamazoniensis]|uniref:Uncharacterized protein n=1 Tax=Neobacillus massiliamazoniensis TaxID=1499688 RepID=A0A0U1NV36_9BACI|nr:hypothetical protein BN000_01817 [Neobacillus massiliamazoniensis]
MRLTHLEHPLFLQFHMYLKSILLYLKSLIQRIRVKSIASLWDHQSPTFMFKKNR